MNARRIARLYGLSVSQFVRRVGALMFADPERERRCRSHDGLDLDEIRHAGHSS